MGHMEIIPFFCVGLPVFIVLFSLVEPFVTGRQARRNEEEFRRLISED